GVRIMTDLEPFPTDTVDIRVARLEDGLIRFPLSSIEPICMEHGTVHRDNAGAPCGCPESTEVSAAFESGDGEVEDGPPRFRGLGRPVSPTRDALMERATWLAEDPARVAAFNAYRPSAEELAKLPEPIRKFEDAAVLICTICRKSTDACSCQAKGLREASARLAAARIDPAAATLPPGTKRWSDIKAKGRSAEHLAHLDAEVEQIAAAIGPTPSDDIVVDIEDEYAARVAAEALAAQLQSRLDRLMAASAEAITVHALRRGRAVCRFVDAPPGSWPEGHRWAKVPQNITPGAVLCDACWPDAVRAKASLAYLHFATDGNDGICGPTVDPESGRQAHYTRDRSRFIFATANRCPKCWDLLGPDPSTGG